MSTKTTNPELSAWLGQKLFPNAGCAAIALPQDCISGPRYEAAKAIALTCSAWLIRPLFSMDGAHPGAMDAVITSPAFAMPPVLPVSQG